MDCTIEVSRKDDHRWYVVTGPREGRIYLHVDGQWRSTTATVAEGKLFYGGYFPTQIAAYKIASEPMALSLASAILKDFDYQENRSKDFDIF